MHNKDKVPFLNETLSPKKTCPTITQEDVWCFSTWHNTTTDEACWFPNGTKQSTTTYLSCDTMFAHKGFW